MKTLMLILLLISCSTEDIEYTSTNNIQWNTFELSTLSIINDLRGVNNQLIQDDNLYKFAKDRAYNISINGVSHEGFNEVSNKLKNKGLISVAENLAGGYNDPEILVLTWSKSESHNNIIINPMYKYTGIGVIDNYVCMILAR